MTNPTMNLGRRLLAAVLLVCGVGMLGACAQTTDLPGGGPTESKSTHVKADCTSEKILSALPGGATMERFDCAKVGDTEWAAAQVNPGNTVFFLQWNGAVWNAEDSDSICGAASAGLPEKLLSYCQPAASSKPPTPSPLNTPVTEACTAQAILAALPGGATMEKFTCADVGGQLWAAARVNPGDTAFFLQWNGTKWNAEDSDSVCGAASAGLPEKLLSYCQ